MLIFNEIKEKTIIIIITLIIIINITIMINIIITRKNNNKIVNKNSINSDQILLNNIK